MDKGTIVLKRHLWIKPGTVFSNIDGVKREFVDGNFEALISLSNDTTMSVVVSADVLEERPELFGAAASNNDQDATPAVKRRGD